MKIFNLNKSPCKNCLVYSACSKVCDKFLDDLETTLTLGDFMCKKICFGRYDTKHNFFIKRFQYFEQDKFNFYEYVFVFVNGEWTLSHYNYMNENMEYINE